MPALGPSPVQVLSVLGSGPDDAANEQQRRPRRPASLLLAGDAVGFPDFFAQLIEPPLDWTVW